ncbi:MAG TPA: hypothetical protein VNT79_03735 [Phycisphaerae bacterium]|nr:hypothetical protein [Phycisphaerae bacterium]
MTNRILVFAIVVSFSLTPAAPAALVPFTEHFPADEANWRDAAGINEATWLSAGGPTNDSYVATDHSFSANPADSFQSIFRGHDAYDSSGDAFVGNWLADGATGFSAWVRHDAPLPLNFFARYAKPMSAGAASFEVVPVLPDTWTQLTFNLAFGTSNLILEGPPSPAFYNSVFSDIHDVQIGVQTPSALAGTADSYTFGLDRVSLLPEPASVGLIAVAFVALIRPRRQRGIIH